MLSKTGWVSVGELLVTRRISPVAVCCSSASLSSRVRASTFCSRVAYDSSSCAADRLNWSANVSSSSPVRTSMRWPSSPAPIRAAPAWSAWIGLTMRRARTVLASTENATPSRMSTAARRMDARIPSKASTSGCSTNTSQRSGEMGAKAVSTCRP